MSGSETVDGSPPLRILLVIESAGGGSGRHVIDLSAGLIRRGHRVTLLYSPVRADRWFVDEARAIEGLELAEIEIHRTPGVSDALAAWHLRRFVRRQGPFDVIHGHSAKAGAIVRLGALGLAGLKVYTPHAFITLNPLQGRLGRFVYANAERILAWMGDRIICVSEEERRHALELGIDPKRLVVINNGQVPLPEADRDEARRMMELDQSALCIGCVGRLSDQKAIDRLLRAFAEVAPRIPGARLVVVGTGPHRKMLENLAGQLSIADRVRFHGGGNGPALMAGFDVYAMSSVYEAFPYVYIEALSRGLPIVTTPVGGSGAVVENGQNGLVADSLEPTSLAVCMEEVCRDSQRRQAMGQASLERARLFTVDAMVDRTEAEYRQARKAPQ